MEMKSNSQVKKDLIFFRNEMRNQSSEANPSLEKYLNLKNELLIKKLQTIESGLYNEMMPWKIAMTNPKILEITSYYLGDISFDLLMKLFTKSKFTDYCKNIHISVSDVKDFSIKSDSPLMNHFRKFTSLILFDEDFETDNKAEILNILGLVNFYNPYFFASCKELEMSMVDVKKQSEKASNFLNMNNIDMKSLMAKIPMMKQKIEELFDDGKQEEIKESLKEIMTKLKENKTFIEFFELTDLMKGTVNEMDEQNEDEEMDEMGIMNKMAEKFKDITDKCNSLKNNDGFREKSGSIRKELAKIVKIIQKDPNVKKIIEIMGKEFGIDVEQLLKGLKVKKIKM